MSQFFKKNFYFDKTRERAISVEWNKGCREVYISENGKDLAKYEGTKELLKGVSLKTEKGENAYVKVYVRPFRWEVKIGDRYLINSHNNSSSKLKSTSNIFYFIGGMLLLLLVLMALIAGFDRVLWGSTFMIITYLHILAYIGCGILIRKGQLWAYYVGTVLFIGNTAWMIYTGMESSPGMTIFFTLIRGIFIYYLIKAYKHVVELRKHQKEVETNEDDELLDI